eukprot:UN31507
MYTWLKENLVDVTISYLEEEDKTQPDNIVEIKNGEGVTVTFNRTSGKITSVVGSSRYGELGSEAKQQLTDSFVTHIVPNKYAFCALTRKGQIVTWGSRSNGGRIGLVGRELECSTVTFVTNTDLAFAVLTKKDEYFPGP